jgi:LasA protease
LANGVARMGGLVAILVGLALCAIIQQEITARTEPHRVVKAQIPSTAPSRPQPRLTPKATRTDLAAPLGQVRTTVLRQRGASARGAFGVKNLPQPDVHLTRIDEAKGWAFGTAAIPPPPGMAAVPDPSVFIARRSGKTWQVALAGVEDFVRLVRQAPTTVIPADERPFLEQYGEAASAKEGVATGMTLPWGAGQSWTMQSIAGVDALQFSGGDGRVLAPAPGRLYRFCTRSASQSMLLLIHADGLASEYYQMADVADIKEGALVQEGGYLGHTGTARPCGGAAPASGPPTVDFTLFSGASPMPLEGTQIGGWTLHAAGDQVWADRSGLRVNAGNPLLNFGALDAPPSPTPRSPSARPSPRSPSATPSPRSPSATPSPRSPSARPSPRSTHSH